MEKERLRTKRPANDEHVSISKQRQNTFKVCAIIVTYGIYYDSMRNLLDAVQTQVDKLYIIDNNEKESLYSSQNMEENYQNFTVLRNEYNLGLARALNQGIRAAMADGFNYFLLLDQDSLPIDNTVNKLLSAMISLEKRGEKVAAVGCSIYDRNRKEYLPFLRYKSTGVKKINAESLTHSKQIEVDFLITSGSLISARALKATGLMDETLFIDNVDLEWCFRAKNMKFRLYGVSDAIILHRLGEDFRRVPFSNRSVLIHEPIRQYYIMRNRLWLYRRPYVPFVWKIHDFPRLVFKVLFYVFMVRPAKLYAIMMFRGAFHGILHTVDTPKKGIF